MSTYHISFIRGLPKAGLISCEDLRRSLPRTCGDPKTANISLNETLTPSADGTPQERIALVLSRSNAEVLTEMPNFSTFQFGQLTLVAEHVTLTTGVNCPEDAWTFLSKAMETDATPALVADQVFLGYMALFLCFGSNSPE